MLLLQPDEYCTLWHGSKGYSGVSLHVRRTLCDAPGFSHPAFDFETRVVAADLGPAIVASVYVPNGGKDYPAKLAFLEALAAFAAGIHAAGRELVLAGDLNVARTDRDVHPRERKPNAVGQRPDERALFERLAGLELVDVARALHPDDDALFTWWAPWRNLRQRNIGWRIDYILASATLAARARTFVSAREFGTSDHAPITVEFA
jgi:exodeoxyribonuclease-3